MAPAKILLVEDSPRDVQLLRLCLEALPEAQRPQLTHVDSLAGALDGLESEGYDCVLLDLNLPDASGSACVQALREAQRSVPIVVMTGLDDDRSAADALRCGAQEYLVKGHFNERALARVIGYAIERQAVLMHMDQERSKSGALLAQDSLTGLPNRYKFEQATREQLRLCARREERFALALFDLDGFRAINERYGYATGDAVLQEVAGVLARGLRAGDMVARIGGDEFAVLLADTPDFGIAQMLAQRLADGVRMLGSVRGRPLQLGLNCGVALYPEQGASVESLFLAAEAAQAQARRGARSEVRVNTAVADALVRGYARAKAP